MRGYSNNEARDDGGLSPDRSKGGGGTWSENGHELKKRHLLMSLICYMIGGNKGDNRVLYQRTERKVLPFPGMESRAGFYMLSLKNPLDV